MRMSVVLTFFLILKGLFASIPFYDFAKYQELSEKLFYYHGISPDNHSILQRNAIYYLHNYLSAKDLETVLSLKKEAAFEKLYIRNFWADKLERDLSQPYSDQDFFTYFENLKKETQAFLRYLSLINPQQSPLQIHIYGSFAKARIGANSSLDLLIESQDLRLLQKIEDGIYSKDHPDFQGNIEVTTSLFGAKFLLSPFLSISVKELSDLETLYKKAMDQYGFGLDVFRGRMGVKLLKEPRTAIEFNPIEDRVYFLVSRLVRLEKEIRASFQIYQPGAKDSENSKREEFLKNLKDLIGHFSEVEGDLSLIVKRVENERHQKIRSVIQSPSYERMKSHRSKMLLSVIEQKKRVLHEMIAVLK